LDDRIEFLFERALLMYRRGGRGDQGAKLNSGLGWVGFSFLGRGNEDVRVGDSSLNDPGEFGQFGVGYGSKTPPHPEPVQRPPELAARHAKSPATLPVVHLYARIPFSVSKKSKAGVPYQVAV
jgi:hypothetical protein